MSELKLPRLLAAAKEFNIGQDTLIEFLGKKGFPKDDLKPTAKLTEDQYYALQAEFQSDKVAKNKADHVELPKGAAADKKAATAETAKPAKETKAVVSEEAPKAKKVVAETPAAPVESVKIDAPEVEAPKVVNKIDLSLIDSSTRPKKSAKKAAEPANEASPVGEAAKKAADGEAKSSSAKKAATKAPKEEPVAPVAPVDHSIAPENVHGEITNIQADKLTGPKILGKIDLPINSDTRPKPLSQEEKRVRKRIPVQGGGNRPQGGGTQQQQGGGNRPQGGGGYQGNRPLKLGLHRPQLAFSVLQAPRCVFVIVLLIIATDY
jgi:translation initiation factor IF-2